MNIVGRDESWRKFRAINCRRSFFYRNRKGTRVEALVDWIREVTRSRSYLSCASFSIFDLRTGGNIINVTRSEASEHLFEHPGSRRI